MKKRLKKLAWQLIPGFLSRRYFSRSDEKWVEVEERVISIFLSKTTESIDVGANHGRYTVLMSLFSGHVYAFEPNPECVSNLQDLCLPNASLHDCALSSTEGFSEYFAPVEDGVSRSALGTLERSVLSASRHIDTIRVAKSTLDSLWDKPISFVKIDVEGHEMEVLNGGRKLISVQKPVFMVEAEERHTRGTVPQMKEFFEEFDYQGFYIWENKVFPFASFNDELQNPDELMRPVPRVEMRYVNNFIFIPNSLDTQSLVALMNAKLGTMSKGD